MRRRLRYALLSSTLAYIFIALALVLLTGFINRWDTIGNDIVPGLTLTLSEYQWWGDFSYAAVIVPWLGSAAVMLVLLRRFGVTHGRRRLLAGFSIFAYYLVMLISLLIIEAISHGEIRYEVHYDFIQFSGWLPGGFIMGYLSAMIADKIVQYPVTDRLHIE
jgi:hypothetical protein